MTVATENKSHRYVATADQTVFPYEFRILDETHIDVYQNGTLLTLTTHYTVSGVGAASGGNITLVTGATVSDAITLLRDVPNTQLTDYVENDAFPAEAHEEALDKLTMALQEQVEEIDRAIKFAPKSTYTDLDFPDPGTSGQAVTWTASGTLQNTTLALTDSSESVDETDTDTTKDKLVSNSLAKGWEDYKDVGHLPLAGGAITGDTTVTAEFDITGGLGVTGDAQVDNLNLNGNAIISTDTDGDITITPNGSGDVVIDGLAHPQADGSAKQVLKTDGSGNLDFANFDDLWTYSGSIDLTSGSPTAVALLSSLSNVSEIEIYIELVSTNTANQAPMIQIGDSGGLETSGYSGRGWSSLGAHSSTNNSSGFLTAYETDFDAANNANFNIVLRHFGSNVWCFSATGAQDGRTAGGEGAKTLSAALDRVTITTSGGSATFDGGTAYARYR